jgi:hypothetical protein
MDGMRERERAGRNSGYLCSMVIVSRSVVEAEAGLVIAYHGTKGGRPRPARVVEVAVAPQHKGLELAGRGRRGSVVGEAGARESGSGAGDRTLLGLGFRVVARRGANELRIGGEMEEDREVEQRQRAAGRDVAGDGHGEGRRRWPGRRRACVSRKGNERMGG